MIIAGRWRRTLQFFPLLFVVFILLVVFLERSGLVLPLATESNFIWNGLSRTSAQGPLPYILLVGFFALTAIVFVPLGQEIALRLERFRPITGYSINIVGSLVGVVGFALISYLRWPPVAWFGLGSVAFLIVFATSGLVPRRGIVGAALLLGVGLIVIAGAHRVAPGPATMSRRHFAPAPRGWMQLKSTR